VELLGGSLKVYSEKNIGSRFSFAVPLKKGLEKDLPVSRELVLNPTLFKGQHILIADDNELNRLLVTSVLQHYGASFTEALSGEEAIQILQQLPMHLILMDVQMPGISGLESSQFIREKLKSNVPIIALTSNTAKSDLEQYSEYGMSDYLTKPFTEEDLIEKIGRLLHIPVEWKKAKLTLESPVSCSRYSTHKLKTIGRGDIHFVKKMLTSFILHTSSSIEEMQSAYDQKNFPDISKIIHRIKPDIDCLEIVELKESIRELEKLGKTGNDHNRIKALLDIVSETLKAIIQDIQLKHLEIKPSLAMVKKLKLNNNPTRFHSFKLNVPEAEILKRKTRVKQG
jgi:CheY-like chemotaxis protein/HPt (histidine-containing phosphotransfer) domain-containing protein